MSPEDLARVLAALPSEFPRAHPPETAPTDAPRAPAPTGRRAPVPSPAGRTLVRGHGRV